MTATPRHQALWRRLPAADRQAWSGLLRVYRTVVPRLDADLEREHRLPLSHYDVLVQVANAPEGLRMGQLAAEVLLSPSGLTRLVDRLVGGGLVERRPGDADVRQIYVAITPRGLELVAEATATHLLAVRDLFLDRLDPDEKDVLARAFARILDTDSGPQPVGDQPAPTDPRSSRPMPEDRMSGAAGDERSRVLPSMMQGGGRPASRTPRRWVR